MLKPLSLRAYAKHRKEKGLPGGSLPAVRKAIKSGRITADPENRIADPETADREWVTNTDLTRIPGWAEHFADESDADGDDGPKMSEESAREKHFKANLAELTYLERAGELVNADELATEYSNRCSVVRTRMLGIPSKLKQAHPDLPHAVLVALELLTRDALTELADGATA
jgi:hypothetical protein